MKQHIDYGQWLYTSPQVQLFILIWKQKRFGNQSPLLTIGECLELLAGVTRNLHHDESDGRFFNNLLQNNESIIGWDGEQLIDILYFELVKEIKHYVANGQKTSA